MLKPVGDYGTASLAEHQEADDTGDDEKKVSARGEDISRRRQPLTYSSEYCRTTASAPNRLTGGGA
jgi:hypothetical protein